MSGRALLRTSHERAAVVAAALRPDNTSEMETTVESSAEQGATVVTWIDRESASGLRSTVDDYVVNLQVASRVVDVASDPTDAKAGSETDAQPASDATDAQSASDATDAQPASDATDAEDANRQSTDPSGRSPSPADAGTPTDADTSTSNTNHE